jgi:hypothetical protein
MADATTWKLRDGTATRDHVVVAAVGTIWSSTTRHQALAPRILEGAATAGTEMGVGTSTRKTGMTTASETGSRGIDLGVPMIGTGGEVVAGIDTTADGEARATYHESKQTQYTFSLSFPVPNQYSRGT